MVHQFGNVSLRVLKNVLLAGAHCNNKQFPIPDAYETVLGLIWNQQHIIIQFYIRMLRTYFTLYRSVNITRKYFKYCMNNSNSCIRHTFGTY